MTELKSYSLPELEELAEQIKATILKREQEEQEAAQRQAEEAERAARAAEEEAARLAAEAVAKAAAEAEEKARAATAARERKQAAEKARREAAEAKAKAKAQAEAEKAKEAAQAEISFAEAAPPAPTEMPLVRFMHPSNRALTWSGDGPKPDWVNAWLATGGTLYALEVAAEKLAPRPIPASLRPR